MDYDWIIVDIHNDLVFTICSGKIVIWDLFDGNNDIVLMYVHMMDLLLGDWIGYLGFRTIEAVL